jgi:hypothetical protein
MRDLGTFGNDPYYSHIITAAQHAPRRGLPVHTLPYRCQTLSTSGMGGTIVPFAPDAPYELSNYDSKMHTYLQALRR